MRVTRHDNVISREIRNSISGRYKRITQAINHEFWGSESETANSLYVGSYGRNTAIKTSDIDILIKLPPSEFDRFNSLTGNAQSRLLQAVRIAIKKIYPRSDIRADGQIVKVNFSDGVIFEVLPGFKNLKGVFVYPNSNMGGNWLSTNPKAEQEAIKEKNKSSNNLLVSTCRHMRYIRDNYFKSYHLSGIVIDSFVYNAIGDWRFIEKSNGSNQTESYEQSLLNYYNNNCWFWEMFDLKVPGSLEKISVEKSKLCLEKVLNHMTRCS